MATTTIRVRATGPTDQRRILLRLVAETWTSPLPRLVLAVTLVLAACSVTEEEAASFATVDCPPEVTEGIPLVTTCGFLTVPENRSDPEGRTIQLFVTRMQPSGGDPAPDPLILLGADLAYSPLQGAERVWREGGIGPSYGLVADRVQREVITLMPRGVGLSLPSLQCDELAELRGTISGQGASAGDPAYLDVFLEAVGACHDRLTDDGIDLSAYNLAEMAADVEDLRIALGYEEWNMEALGTSSVVAFEVLRRYPDHFRSLTLDSPDAPQVDLFSEAIIGTRDAFGRLAERCGQDAACNTAYPDLERTLNMLLDDLHATPEVIPSTSAPEHYQVDDGMMIRMVRSMLGTMGAPSTVPKQIAFAREFGPNVLAGISGREDPMLTVGYTYGGSEAVDFTYGAFYSVLCHDELPFADPDELRALAGDEDWYRTAYAESPYEAVCERWDVGQAAADPHHLPSSDVPTLILIGRFDPYAPRRLVAQAAEGLERSWLGEVPFWAHNVLVDQDCPISIRNAWIDDPTAPPDMSCLDTLDELEFDTSPEAF